MMLKQNLRALGKLVSPDFKRQSSIFAKKKTILPYQEYGKKKEWTSMGSNHGPPDYESGALTS